MWRQCRLQLSELECKALDNFLRLREVVEEKMENITKKITGLFAEYLGEQLDDVVFNLDLNLLIYLSF